MRFDPSFIDKVRDANNIVDIISKYTQLKPAGSRHTGLCPFPDHNEKTPSFSVTEDKQLYYCFGCKKSGNIFHFVQALQGLSFVESIEFLANKAGIPIPKSEQERNPALQRMNDEKKSAYQLLQSAAQFYHNNLLKLPETHPAKQYCKKRNITPEMVKEFQLGFAPDSWDSLKSFLASRKISEKLGKMLGLLKLKRSGDGLYDQYRNRLMFPIVTQAEKHVGFGGRVLDDSLPKYINSSESIVFHKSKILYGLDQTSKYIRTKDYVIVVEGYMDLLALYSHGVQNVVATLGTALTPQHAKLISRYTSKVVLLFDGDKAGQAAAKKSLAILLEEKLLPRSVVLPDNMDPDDYINKNGVDSFKEQVAASEDLFFIVMNDLFKNYKGAATDKVYIMEELAPIMSSVKHKGLYELYMRELCDRLNVTEKWVLSMVSPSKKSNDSLSEPVQQQAPEPVVEESLMSLAKAPRHELYLINMALKNKDHFVEIIESDILKQISDQNLSKLFTTAEQLYRQRPEDFDKLTSLLVNKIDQPAYLTGHMREPLSIMDDSASKKLIEDCKIKVKKSYIKAQTQQRLSQLKQGSDMKEKLEQIMNIQKGKLDL